MLENIVIMVLFTFIGFMLSSILSSGKVSDLEGAVYMLRHEVWELLNKKPDIIITPGKRLSINQLVTLAHNNAKKKGFWKEPRETGTILALIHSEVSEALEADRKGTEEEFQEELADIIIRVFDVAGARKVDLESVICKKMMYNQTRPALHGKKY
jgi:NTP pyrophosphatase (non-canonical NTP hydrolase)